MPPEELAHLRQLMLEAFNQGEIRTLCFDLGIAYDDLSGENRAGKVRELIAHCQRNGQLEALIDLCARRRPHLAWPSQVRQSLDDCPYKGMRYYDVNDAPLFFGREALSAELVERLFPQPPHTGDNSLAIVGASGSGKSSLVRAGVVATLQQRPEWRDRNHEQQGSHAGHDGSRIHIITPTARPLRALATSLTQNSESVRATAILIDDLKTDKRTLDLYVQRLVKQTNSAQQSSHPTPLLLIIDQFEELFTQCKEEAERQAFVENLLYALEETTACPLTVVLTLRADFYHRCAEFEGLRLRLEQQQKYIGPMAHDELRRAIEQPAAKQGLRFESQLVDTMLDDVGEEPGGLPLLSHALQETWRRQKEGKLTHVGYRAAGGVRGAIAQTADNTFAALTKAEQAIARNIFLRLTELGEGTEDTRRRVQQIELYSNSQEAVATETVVQKLANARLLTTDRNEIEVAHEALIREWETLGGWLDADREGLQIHGRLTRAAQQWAGELKRDPDALYRGLRLAKAESWARESNYMLNAIEQEFLTASQQLRHELLRDAQSRAVEQAQTANEMRRRAHILGGILIILMLLAIGTSFILNDARKQRDIAIEQSIASLSSIVLQQKHDTDLAKLLAIEVAQTNQAGSEQIWLIDSMLRSLLKEETFTNAILSGHNSFVLSAAFSPNDNIVASTSADHTIRLWDLEGSSKNPIVLSGHKDWVRNVSFSPNGNFLASASTDETIRLWDLQNLEDDPIILSGHDGTVWAVTFSKDGNTLFSASSDSTVRLWDLQNLSNEPIILTGHKSSVLSVSVSPNGNKLASAGADRAIHLWDLRDLTTQPVILMGHTDWVRSIAFSPDGKTLASASSDHTVRLWDVQDQTKASVMFKHADWVWSVAFSPDGKTLASASADFTVNLWNVHEPTHPLAILSGHKGQVRSVAFSTDGSRLISASRDHTVRLWIILDELIRIGCEEVQRNLTLDEWKYYFGTREYKETCPNKPHPSEAEE
ncbi:MAG: hypothetical protein AAF614_37870 [Chloroflexota bacterium]